MHTSGVNTTTMQTLLLHWDAKLKRTSPQESARHGHPTPPVVTRLAMHGNTTSATRSTSVTQKASKLV
jgi:hypothetical protein